MSRSWYGCPGRKPPVNNEPVRPATFADVKHLINALNEAGAKYLLIGDYALYAHGYHRTTEGVDILIPANRRSGEVVKKALLKLPDKVSEAIDVAWVEEGETIRIADEFKEPLILPDHKYRPMLYTILLLSNKHNPSYRKPRSGYPVSRQRFAITGFRISPPYFPE